MHCWLIHRAISCLLLLLLISPLHAQEPYFVKVNGGNEALGFSVKVGEEKQLELPFLIQKGFHIQANQVQDENLIPTSLTLDAPEEWTIGEAVFPEMEEFAMKGVEEPLYVFGDTLHIKVPIKVTEVPEQKEFLINGKLHYQPCDYFKCYFPRDLDFVLTINVKD